MYFPRRVLNKLIILDSEKDSFLPKSPPQSKPSTKETRHWIPSTSHHVIITPEMLNEQSNLESPYDPNPFNDPELEHVLNPSDFVIRKERHDTNGTMRSVTKRKTRWTKMQAIILNRGYVPFALRLISWIFSIVALFLAGFITRFSVRDRVATRPSTVMAFVVNGVAIFYLPLVAKVFSVSTRFSNCRTNILGKQLGFVRRERNCSLCCLI
jgi:hypothetical protein